MIVDSLILAGGRSARLGHSDKQKLQIGGMSLLERSVEAVRGVEARSVVVVGDEKLDAAVTVRESPAFAGPVAAIAAGLRELSDDADAILVLACDMPEIGRALPVLLAGVTGDGAIALDRGRRQHLALAVRPSALAAALETLPTVADSSMRQLLAPLDLAEVAVPEGSTDDIDTWADAERFGIAPPTTTGVSP